MAYSFLVVRQTNSTGVEVKAHRMMFGGASRFLGAVANDPSLPFACPAAPTQSSPNTTLDFQKTGVRLAPNGVSTIGALFSAQQNFIGTFMQRATAGTWQPIVGGQIGPWQLGYRSYGMEMEVSLHNPAKEPLEGFVQAAYRMRQGDEPEPELAIRLLDHAGPLPGEYVRSIELESTGSSFNGCFSEGAFAVPAGETLTLSGKAVFDANPKETAHAVLFGQVAAGRSITSFAIIGMP